MRRGGEENTDKEKLRERLEIITGEYSPVRAVSDGHSQYEECEVLKIQNEILSVKTVLEMKMEEVRGLRKELERRSWWREEKGTQTEVDKEVHGSSADKTCR